MDFAVALTPQRRLFSFFVDLPATLNQTSDLSAAYCVSIKLAYISSQGCCNTLAYDPDEALPILEYAETRNAY